MSPQEYYSTCRDDMVAQVPKSARAVLDVGCGTGETLLALKARGVAFTAGIEIHRPSVMKAKKRADHIIYGDVETATLNKLCPLRRASHLGLEVQGADDYRYVHYDVVLCADVLEHLKEPTECLKKLAKTLKPDGRIIMSIPNIGFVKTVEMLLRGYWQYEDAGIMDRSHLRFFCRSTVEKMIEDAGMELKLLRPLRVLDEIQMPENATVLDFAQTEEHKEQLLTYQWLAIAANKEKA